MPRRLWVVAAVGWTAASVFFLWMPLRDTPGLDIPDKVLHFSLFFGIGFAWHRGLGRAPWRLLAWAAVLGVVTEVVQGMLPWPRSPEVADVVADLIGAGLAIAASVWLSARSSTAER